MPDYGPLYSTAGTQWGIDPLLLQSMANEESGENPNAVGPVIQSGPAAGQRALGFMQFLPGTAKQYSVDTSNPSSSVFGAGNYMADLLYKQNLPIRQALATYGGTAGNPNSGYVNTVMDRYKALKNAWGAGEPPPATDTDPNSPTYGQPTTRSLKPGASAAPAVDTTAKGNPGQPGPNVPTTGSVPGGISAAAPSTFAPPGQGGPSGQRKTAQAAPSHISDIPVTHNEDGSPIATAEAAGPAPKSAIADIPVTHNEDGTLVGSEQPPTPQAGQQYLTAATSPGAKSVGSTAQIAEGRYALPGVQAAINVATDPGQQARIAADQLNIPLDRIVIGEGGRLAAVDDQGQRYYIQPPPVFSQQGGYTKVPGGYFGGEGGAWHPINVGQVSPYSRVAPLGPGATPTDVPLAMGGAIPGAVTGAVSWAPAAVGGPLTGALGVGAATYGAETGRQWLANRLDPNNALAPTPGTGNEARDAAGNALMALGFRAGPWLAAGAPRPAWAERNPLATQTQFPGRQPMPLGPASPVAPGEVIGPAIPQPGAAAVPAVVDPFEGAAEKSGPYAATKPEETAAQPTHLPPPRFPILTQNQVENRADDIIRHFAQGGNTVPDTRQLIAQAGLPQTTGNGGLAALWRYMATSTPEGINAMQGFKDRALLARRNFTRDLVGTSDDLNALEAARTANTQQTYNNAFGPRQTEPVNAQPVLDRIDEILHSAEGMRSDIADPLRKIRDMFYERDPITGQLPTDANGTPIRTLIDDPERLYQVRRDINDSMRGPMANSTLPNARAASHLLGDVQNTLDSTIAEGAPNYPQYMQQYQAQSKEINAMRFLQGRNLTDANGDTTLVKVDSAIKAAERDRNLDPRMRPADALTDDQMQQLYTLRDDLRRQANETKGKALGSDTAQNFSTSAVVNNLVAPAARLGARATALKVAEATGVPFLEYPALMAESWIENRLTGGEARASALRQAVIRRLLNEDNSGTRALLAGQTSPPTSGSAP